MSGPVVDELMNAERVAADTIRGFMTQIYWTVERWLALPEQAFLVCEGDEDIDQYLRDGDGRFYRIAEQVKDVTGTLSARDPAVHETLFDFLRLYGFCRGKGRDVRFVFTTSAAIAKQTIQEDAVRETESKALLAVDVLRTWLRAKAQDAAEVSTEPLRSSIRELARAYLPAPGSEDRHGRAAVKRASEVRTVLEMLDAENLWLEFIGNVTWKLSQLTGEALIETIRAALTVDARTLRLPPDLLLHRLAAEVMDRCSAKEIEDRVLDSQLLEQIARVSEVELRTWVDARQAYLLPQWSAHFEARLEKLEHRMSTVEDALSPSARVARISAASRRQIRDSSAIYFSGEYVRLSRRVVTSLEEMARVGPLLVVGEPGAGKSGALEALAERLEAQGAVVVTVHPDYLEPDAVADLQAEFGSEDSRERFLIVDALDATRGGPRARALKMLITSAARQPTSWHVVASVRTYDLTVATEFRLLFRGEPHASDRDDRFSHVRHVHVPVFSEPELLQLRGKCPSLWAALDTLGSEVRDLARNAFNLSILALLVDEGVSLSSLSRVATQVELLDCYWDERVHKPIEKRFANVDLLNRLCSRMIQELRLSISHRGLGSHSEALDRLLSSNVLRLIETSAAGNGTHVAYAHNILFDYGVARTWLSESPQELVEQLRNTAALPLFARPALDAYFERLWVRDSRHSSFWATALEVQGASGVRASAKVVAPSVAVRFGAAVSDFVAILDALPGDAALGMVRHLASAFELLPVSARGPHFYEMAAELATANALEAHHAAYRMLWCAREALSVLEAEQAANAGRAARALLTAERNASQPRWKLVGQLATLVLATYFSDRAASREAVEPLLTAGALGEHGSITLPFIARALDSVLARDQDLVADVFVAAFDHVDTSSEPTVMRSGVLTLRGTRKQDYAGALYTLGHQIFPSFLARHPDAATTTLVHICSTYAAAQSCALEPSTITFNAVGGRTSMLLDASHWWAEFPHHDHDVELVMWGEWERHFLATAEKGPGDADALIATLRAQDPPAFMWSRLLRLVADAPQALKQVGIEMLKSPRFATIEETSRGYRAVLETLWPELSPELREAVSESLSTNDHGQPADAVLQLLDRLARSSNEAANQHRLRSDATVEMEPQLFSSEPVDVDALLPQLREPVQELAEEDAAGAQLMLADLREQLLALVEVANTDASSGSALSQLQKLVESLGDLGPLQSRGIGAFRSSVVEAIRPILPLSVENAAARPPLRALLLWAVTTPLGEPTVKPEPEREIRSLGARAIAVRMLCDSISVAGFATLEVREVIRELTLRDPSAEIRFAAASRLHFIARFAPELARSVCAEALEKEDHADVAAVLLHALPFLLDPAGAVGAARGLYSRFAGRDEGVPLRLETHYLDLQAQFHVIHGLSAAHDAVKGALVPPLRPAVVGMTRKLRSLLAYATADAAASAQVRARAFSFAAEVVEAVFARLKSMVEAAEADPDEARAVVTTLDSLAADAFYSSLAYDQQRWRKEGSSLEQPARDSRERFWSESGEFLTRLADVPLPTVSHYVVQIARENIEFSPLGALELATTAVLKGRSGGYEHDDFAIEVVVELVEFYLSEHRDLLQSQAVARQSLLDLLDVFVDVGWPQALRLVYRLDDAFR